MTGASLDYIAAIPSSSYEFFLSLKKELVREGQNIVVAAFSCNDYSYWIFNNVITVVF